MKRRHVHWYVSCIGYWWQFGKWTKTPDFARGLTNLALPKTKAGAFRIAGHAPVGAIVFVDGWFDRKTKKYPQGYHRTCSWTAGE